MFVWVCVFKKEFLSEKTAITVLVEQSYSTRGSKLCNYEISYLYKIGLDLV